MGGDTAQMRPRDFGTDPPDVVAGHSEQDRGGVDADAADLEQLRGSRAHERFELFVEHHDFLVDGLRTSGERNDRGLGRVTERVAPGAGPERGACGDQRFGGVPGEPHAQIVGAVTIRVTEQAADTSVVDLNELAPTQTHWAISTP
jgi:hypothetical protein